MQTIDVRSVLRGMTDEQAIRKRADWFRGLVARGLQSATVRDAAMSIKARAPNDPAGQLQLLHSMVRDRVRFENDPPEGDTYRDASVTLRIRAGDCDDKTILFCSIAKLLGFRCGFYFMAQGWNYVHVIPFAFLPSGQKIYFETTLVKPFNWRPQASKGFEAMA